MVSYILRTLLYPWGLFRSEGSEHFARAAVAGGAVRAGTAALLALEAVDVARTLAALEISWHLRTALALCLALLLWLGMTLWITVSAWGAAAMLGVRVERVLGVWWRAELAQLPAVLVLAVWRFLAAPPTWALLLFAPGAIWGSVIRLIGLSARLRTSWWNASPTPGLIALAGIAGAAAPLAAALLIACAFMWLVMKSPEMQEILTALR